MLRGTSLAGCRCSSRRMIPPPRASWHATIRQCRTTGTSTVSGSGPTMQLTFLSPEHRARPSASPEEGRDWMIRVATSPSQVLQLLTDIGPAGSSGRMSPGLCRRTEDGRLVPSSEGWLSSGLGSPIAFLTLATSDHPSGVDGFSLSDILEETGDVPQRYYLSERQLSSCEKRLPGFRASTHPGWQRNRPCPSAGDAGRSTMEPVTAF